VLSETAIAFLTVLGTQRRIQILDDQISAIDKLSPLLQKRVDTGASSPAEVGRAEVASALVKADRERVRSSLASRASRTFGLDGRCGAEIRKRLWKLEALGRPPSFQSCHLHRDRPKSAARRWTAVYAQRNAELLVARLKPYPDVRISAGWRHFNETGSDGVRLGISVPIPIFDQNQGNILSAQENLAKVRAERQANRNTLIVIAACLRQFARLVSGTCYYGPQQFPRHEPPRKRFPKGMAKDATRFSKCSTPKQT